MSDSASLKINRAKERVQELSAFLKKNRPFVYVHQEDYQTGNASTFAKRNETLTDQVALICGDIIQNLRTALDHAYWDIVSHVAPNKRAAKAIQFPFSETEARLEEAVKNRLAHKVSGKFFDAIMTLKPHGENGGNELLYAIDRLNVAEKHRELTPIGDYTQIDSAMIQRQVPGFPHIGSATFGMNGRDVVWPVCRPLGVLGRVIERELDVPVAIVLPIGSTGESTSAVSFLNRLIDTAHQTVTDIRDAAN